MAELPSKRFEDDTSLIESSSALPGGEWRRSSDRVDPLFDDPVDRVSRSLTDLA